MNRAGYKAALHCHPMSAINPLAKKERNKPKGVRITDSELSICYKIYRQEMGDGGKGAKVAYERAGEVIDRDWKVVERALKRILPTTDLAEATLRAGAHQLAKRIVSKASVAEAVDVLSRSNIGVIAPKKEAESGGGFFISVQANDCAAVSVGAIQGGQAPKALPAKSEV